MGFMGKRLKKINWKSYNKKLIERGSITFWFPKDIENNWLNEGIGPGFQKIYSDEAIEVVSMIRFFFKLPLRATQGFTESLMGLLGLDLPVPDYSTLSRRMKKLEVKLGKLKSKGKKIHIVLDSTGLKVFGEGEWKVRQHGYSKRRTWMKLHLAVDEADGEILSMSLTENYFKDNELFEDLLQGLEEEISDVSADGAYDDHKVWDFCDERDINPLIPPKKNAVLKQHGNCKAPPLKRDEIVLEIGKHGKKAWRLSSGYSRRSISETAMYRFKTLLGSTLSSRDFERQANEAAVKCKILNRMACPSAL
jgi:hypothetical protein